MGASEVVTPYSATRSSGPGLISMSLFDFEALDALDDADSSLDVIKTIYFGDFTFSFDNPSNPFPF